MADTKNQYAVRRLWEELLYLLKHFGFRKIHTELTFALADPALTGQVLGILCMMPFLYQYDFHIFPDFESESYYIRGSYDMKGRIQLIFLLITFIRIVADKDLRLILKKYWIRDKQFRKNETFMQRSVTVKIPDRQKHNILSLQIEQK